MEETKYSEKAIEAVKRDQPDRIPRPLKDLAVLDKVQSYIEDALAGGALILMGGKPHQRGGLFFEPTILTNVTQSVLVAREETFGPVAPLFRFHTDEETIAIANAIEFDLAAYFCARVIGPVLRVAGAIDAGM